MTDITVNDQKFYTAEEIAKAVNGQQAAGLFASTQKKHYKTSYIKNVLLKIKKEPLLPGYTKNAKKTVRIAARRGAPIAYSAYYVDRAVDILTAKKRPSSVLEDALNHNKLTRKTIKELLLKYGQNPSSDDFQSYIEALYKQNHRSRKALQKAYRQYQQEVQEMRKYLEKESTIRKEELKTIRSIIENGRLPSNDKIEIIKKSLQYWI